MTSRPEADSPGNDRRASVEPRIALPTRTLLLAVVLAILLVAGAWSLAVAFGPWGMAQFTAGIAGIAATSIVAIAGVFVISPWKRRSIAEWMTVWLGGTIFRMMLTPLAAYVLYSALSPAPAVKPFALAVAMAYLGTLFVEAAVLARSVRDSSER